MPIQEDRGQRARILDALGLTGDRLPHVDHENLARYYEYLSANLCFPFQAWYPEPKTARHETVYECMVLELLNPSKHVGEEFDGIFCRTWKSGFEVNLPLVELEVPPENANFQVIEDHWYWFWNWRSP